MLATRSATTKIFMYTNSDIIYFPGLGRTLEYVSSTHDSYLMIGRRHDMVWAQTPVVLNKDTQHAFECYVRLNGRLHSNWGIDYFIFRREDWHYELPPYLPGNWRWDNHIVYLFMLTAHTVIVDATETVTAFHQSSNTTIALQQRAGAKFNDELVRNAVGYRYTLGSTASADEHLTIRYFKYMNKEVSKKDSCNSKITF